MSRSQPASRIAPPDLLLLLAAGLLAIAATVWITAPKVGSPELSGPAQVTSPGHRAGDSHARSSTGAGPQCGRYRGSVLEAC
jgi:hypothetical protein